MLKNTKLTRGLMIGGGIVLGVLVLVGAATATYWQLYRSHADNGFVRMITKILPLPAARVGSEVVLYRDFVRDRDTAKRFLNSPAGKEQAPDVVYSTDVDKGLYEKLIHEAAIRELAKTRNVTVTDRELRTFFTDVLSAAASTTKDVSVYLLDNYGWSEEDFRQLVLKPELLEQKVDQGLSAEQEGSKTALSDYLNTRMRKPDVIRYMTF